MWDCDDTAIHAAFTQQVEAALARSGFLVWKSLPRRRLRKAGSTMILTRVAITCNSASSGPLQLQGIFLGGASTTKAQLNAQITPIACRGPGNGATHETIRYIPAWSEIAP